MDNEYQRNILKLEETQLKLEGTGAILENSEFSFSIFNSNYEIILSTLLFMISF